MWRVNSRAVIFHIQGGLGNQLFQYAAALGMSTRLKMPLILDARGYDPNSNRQFNLDGFEISGRVLRKNNSSGHSLTAMANELGLRLYKFRKGQILENQNDYDDRILSANSTAYFSGYWQNESYFIGVSDILRQHLKFKSKLNVQNSKMLQLIESGPAVAVHVRRGDYLISQENREIYAQLSVSYYARAAKLIADRCRQDLSFYVFSDDPKWAAENIELPGSTMIVDINGERAAVEDLRLMAACDHNVIANSSFSWWGAWLNANSEKIVVAPKKWYNPKSLSDQYINSPSFVIVDN